MKDFDSQNDTPANGMSQTLYCWAKRFALNFLEGRLGGHWRWFWAFLLMTIYPILPSPELGSPLRRISLCFVAYFVAYAYTLIGSLIKPKVLRTVYFTIVFVIVLGFSVIETACLHTIYATLDEDTLAAILATNADEASEFFSVYFSPKVVLAVSILMGLTIGLFVLFRRVHFPTSVVACRMGAILFLCCAVLAVMKPLQCRCTSLGLVRNVFILVSTPRVKVYHNIPKMTVDTDNQPPLIVWIIGESLTSHHCSLYGYDKPTNPFTGGRVQRGEVLLFKNVKAAETHTQEAFQKMMSVCDKSMSGNGKSDECPTLPDIVRAAHYRTHWLSNQSKKGLWDNIVVQYSEFCDTSVFVGNKFVSIQRTNYDGELLPVLRSMLQKDSTAHDFYILHLMGCHTDFERRYPSSFDFFKEKDYKNYPENQRHGLATYDNAVRYNDYVVNSIFDIVSQRDAIVIYAPDHGLDVYESNPNVAAHGNESNPVSLKAALDIPLLIYMTPQFRERHADFAQRTQQNVEREFNMENIVYLIMDLMQCDFRQPIVAQKSLTRK